jgi:hypothetical protein
MTTYTGLAKWSFQIVRLAIVLWVKPLRPTVIPLSLYAHTNVHIHWVGQVELPNSQVYIWAASSLVEYSFPNAITLGAGDNMFVFGMLY